MDILSESIDDIDYELSTLYNNNDFKPLLNALEIRHKKLKYIILSKLSEPSNLNNVVNLNDLRDRIRLVNKYCNLLLN